jgi:hypothetical protein
LKRFAEHQGCVEQFVGIGVSGFTGPLLHSSSKRMETPSIPQNVQALELICLEADCGEVSRTISDSSSSAVSTETAAALGRILFNKKKNHNNYNNQKQRQ